MAHLSDFHVGCKLVIINHHIVNSCLSIPRCVYSIAEVPLDSDRSEHLAGESTGRPTTTFRSCLDPNIQDIFHAMARLFPGNTEFVLSSLYKCFVLAYASLP